MSRFEPGFFDLIYRDTPPWDIGAAQPAMLALLDEHPPEAPVLDVGCGSGDLALAIAERGAEVLGVDVVEAAIEQARERARRLPNDAAARARFQVGDALHPSALGTFGAIVDSGFFHLFDAEQREGLVRELAAALRPGGRFYLLAFATEFPMQNTPLQVTQDEVRTRFTEEAGWRILALHRAQFESRIAPVPAIAACIQRIDG